MTKLSAVIVDDEPLARRGIEIRLAAHPDIEVLACCANGRAAIDAIRAEKPDMVFLDIQMPGIDGFEVLERLAGPDLPFIIFITAYDHFAIRAFDAHALDYLLKPINDARFAEALQRARQAASERDAASHRDRLLTLIAELNGQEIALEDTLASVANGQRYSRRLAIRDGRRTACVDVTDIEWIDAARDYMCIHAKGKTHVLRGTMKMLEQTLDPGIFVRIHRSTIVNRERVVELKPYRNGEFFVRLDSDREFKLSRKYKANIDRIAERL